jgi:hypothetical protein
MFHLVSQTPIITLWEPSIPFACQLEPRNTYHRLIKEGVIRQKELAEHTLVTAQIIKCFLGVQ